MRRRLVAPSEPGIASMVQYSDSSDEDEGDLVAFDRTDQVVVVDDHDDDERGGPSKEELAALPPSPPGEPDPYVQENIRQCIDHQRRGNDFNASLKAHEIFNNPYILETVAKVYEIAEHGTNMPAAMHDPSRFSPDDFFNEIAKRRSAMEAAQQEAMRSRVAASSVSLDTRSIEFTRAAAAGDAAIRSQIRQQQMKLARRLAK